MMSGFATAAAANRRRASERQRLAQLRERERESQSQQGQPQSQQGRRLTTRRARGRRVAPLTATQQQSNLLSEIRQSVSHQARTAAKPNTRRAYDPKIIEFTTYCDSMFSNLRDRDERHKVTNEKLTPFLFYTAHRPKRIGGRNKDYSQFNRHEFDLVMATYNNQGPSTSSEASHHDSDSDSTSNAATTGATVDRNEESKDGEEEPTEERTESELAFFVTKDGTRVPSDPVSWPQFNNYKSALKSLHQEQVLNGKGKANDFTGCDRDLTWDGDIWKLDLKRLVDMVKKRKPMIARENFQEKQDDTFAFTRGSGVSDSIEKELWDTGGKYHRSLYRAFPSIR